MMPSHPILFDDDNKHKIPFYRFSKLEPCLIKLLIHISGNKQKITNVYP